MIRPTPPLEIFSAMFHSPSEESWLGSARHHDLRLELASAAVEAVEPTSDDRPLVVLPAGFLRAPTDESRDGLANELREAARRAEVALVFGIDVGRDDAWGPTEGPPKSFAFLCDAGEPLLWPVQLVRLEKTRRRKTREKRCALIGSRRVSLVVGAEVFSERMRAQVERDEPDLILVLTHLGPNERWRPALDELRRIAPVFVSGDLPDEDGPLWAQAPRGWVVETLTSTRHMTLYRHRRLSTDDAFVRELDETIDEAQESEAIES